MKYFLFRDEIVRSGGIPKNHAMENYKNLKQAQQKNKAKKIEQAEHEKNSKLKTNPKYKNVNSKLREILSEKVIEYQGQFLPLLINLIKKNSAKI